MKFFLENYRYIKYISVCAENLKICIGLVQNVFCKLQYLVSCVWTKQLYFAGYYSCTMYIALSYYIKAIKFLFLYRYKNLVNKNGE